MAQALVRLTSSCSYMRGGRTFVRDIPQMVTDEAEILFYSTAEGFSVQVLAESPKVEQKVETKVQPVQEVKSTSLPVVPRPPTPSPISSKKFLRKRKKGEEE